MKLASKTFDHCFQENGSRADSHYFVKLRKIRFNEIILSFRPPVLLLAGFFHSFS